MSLEEKQAVMTRDDTPSIPEEDLPDHEVGWEERLRREVVRNHRHRWRRLQRLMEENRRSRQEPAVPPSEPSGAGGGSPEAAPEPPTAPDSESGRP